MSNQNITLNFGAISWGLSDPEVWQVNEDQTGDDLLVSDNDFVECSHL